ncbi:MAG: DNA polymerase III subunit gamma/tau [Desulfofustis sp.]|nr:DNA polymerase III subunit gamma/tau [Desulfofustis sp.]
MSYLVFARKYRPQTFEQVVGQTPVVKTLQNSLKRDRVAHALLFSGVRGVGKTTLARLMAKSLNCQEGPTEVPCNECQSCVEISGGSALDLLEIDGASNRGIQEVRELKDKIKFMPTSSRYKIIIIDEVHMLTNEAFNALLKTLEEPPAHVYFIFATTELHKIPVTILSRCQRFELRRVGSEELSGHFHKLAEMEGVELSKPALSLIVREADGSVRDGLSLLDQVLSYGASPIDDNDVVEVLGLVKREVVLSIAEALLTGDRSKALSMLADAFGFGMDVKRFIADLLECFRTLLLIKIGNCEQLLQQSDEDTEQLRTLAQTHPVESIHHKLNLLMQTADDLRFSFQPRLTLETSFLSIISAGDVIGVETLLGKLDNALDSLPEQPAVEQSATSDTAKSEAATEEKKSEDVSTEELRSSPPPKPTFTLEPVDQIEEAESQSEEPIQPRRDVRKDWLEFIAFLKKEKEWMAQSLQQTVSVREDNKELLLEFDDPNDCFVLRSKENRQILTEYVLDFFQQDLNVRIISPENSNGTGVQNLDEPKRRRQQLANHQVVRMAEEIFNGRVGDIRISEPNK